MKFLKLIGFGHLLLLAFSQFIFKYGFLDYQPGLTLTLNDANYTLLVLASVLIAAGGFLITNITSKGSAGFGLSESAAYYIYGGLTISGLVIGYYLSNLIGRPSFMIAFAIPVGTLYFYSTNLRESFILGNITIAFLMALSVMIIGIFAIYPVFGASDKVQLATIFGLITDHSIFTLVLGLLVTLLNDLKNTDADYNEGLNTLPIAIGKKRTVKITFVIGLIAAVMLLYYINEYLRELLWALGYCLLFILGPLVYLLINILSAKTSKDFSALEVVIKAILLFTALSATIITFNIRYHA
ncbi:UbiA family prenyltransferase [Flavobacterium sp. NRK1]|uniref:UbiA family prenyltransferase n=1 Tax=Flavobacterium sp. NRK1 TaxID=2954929 RepID=UPI002091E6D6|nr:UbiA family prenyltransferase [Flavobacterium sp. NRK1]MCO6149300.1 UbiA family prenyltransferase [Flavobacterium sp. NRK1]